MAQRTKTKYSELKCKLAMEEHSHKLKTGLLIVVLTLLPVFCFLFYYFGYMCADITAFNRYTDKIIMLSDKSAILRQELRTIQEDFKRIKESCNNAAE